MKLLAVAGILILLLVLISQLRLGARAEYGAKGILVHLRIGPIWVRVYPGKPGKEKKEKKRAKRASLTPPLWSKEGGGIKVLMQLLPDVLNLVNGLRERLRMDTLEVHCTAGAPDAAAAALQFGGINAALGTLLPVLENSFTVRRRQITTGIDYTAPAPTIRVRCALSIKVSQLVTLLVGAGLRLWKHYSALRAKQVKHSKERKDS